MPGQPIWFDPQMFAGTRSYLAAVWLAGTVVAMVVGGAVAVVLLGIDPLIGVVVAVAGWSILLAGAAPRVASRKRARLDARRGLRPCPSCGQEALGTTCGACGAALSEPDGHAGHDADEAAT